MYSKCWKKQIINYNLKLRIKQKFKEVNMFLGRSSKQDQKKKKSINYRENNWQKSLDLYENTINNVLRKGIVWKKIYAS